METQPQPRFKMDETVYLLNEQGINRLIVKDIWISDGYILYSVSEETEKRGESYQYSGWYKEKELSRSVEEAKDRFVYLKQLEIKKAEKAAIEHLYLELTADRPLTPEDIGSINNIANFCAPVPPAKERRIRNVPINGEVFLVVFDHDSLPRVFSEPVRYRGQFDFFTVKLTDPECGSLFFNIPRVEWHAHEDTWIDVKALDGTYGRILTTEEEAYAYSIELLQMREGAIARLKSELSEDLLRMQNRNTTNPTIK